MDCLIDKLNCFFVLWVHVIKNWSIVQFLSLPLLWEQFWVLSSHLVDSGKRLPIYKGSWVKVFTSDRCQNVKICRPRPSLPIYIIMMWCVIMEYGKIITCSISFSSWNLCFLHYQLHDCAVHIWKEKCIQNLCEEILYKEATWKRGV